MTEITLPAVLVTVAAGLVAWALVAAARPDRLPPAIPPADVPPPPPVPWDRMPPAVGRPSIVKRLHRHYRIADRWRDCLALHCEDRHAAARWWVNNHWKRTRRPPPVLGIRAKGRG